jgi:ankyrin repeat protein
MFATRNLILWVVALASANLPAAYAATAPLATKSGIGTPLETARAALRTRQYGAAVERLRTLATGGDAEAQFLLGEVLYSGTGVAVDLKAAQEWLQKAAQQNHAAAAYVLAAVLTRQGPAATSSANEWLQRSANLGYIRAVEALRDKRPLLAPERAASSDVALTNALALYAARQNDAALLESLGKVAVTATDQFGRGTLATASFAGAADSVAWLLNHGASAQQADSFGVTSLMLAAALDDSKGVNVIVAQLLQHGAAVTAVDKEKRSAMIYAARLDRAQTIKRLAAAGIALDATDSHGYTALDVALVAAADAAAAELRKLGVRQSPTVTARSVHGKFDPAHPGAAYVGWPLAALAIARDDTEELKSQLTAGTSVNVRTPQGDSLLHVALHAQAMGAMELLLARGADPLAADRRGRSVLGLSTARKNPAMLQLLLTAGVAADSHAASEATPLLQAVASENVASVSALLDAKARVNAATESGETPLMLAAALGNVAMLEVLLENGADVRLRNRNGQSALWVGARAGNVAAVQRLISARADSDLPDLQGRTPLMMAAGAGHTKVVEALLRGNARLDTAAADGDTALHLAAAAGRLDVVPLLMKSPATTDKQNRHGDTALIAASRQGYAEVCRELLKAGASAGLRNKSRATAADVARERGFASLAGEIEKRS